MASTRKTLSDFDLNGHQLKQGGTNVFNTSRGAGQSPLAGGDGRIQPWLAGYNTTELYASPAGSNANDGTTWATAKKTVASAYDALPSTGGTIYFEDNTKWSDGTEGGGLVDLNPMWVTARSLTAPSGWRLAKAARCVGVKSRLSSGFGYSGRATLLMQSATNDRFHPSLWWVGFVAGLSLENAVVAGTPRCCARIGWDYARKPDFSLLGIAVTSAVRAAGSTTYTLSPLPSYSVLSGSRSGGIVTLVLDPTTLDRNTIPFDGSARFHLTSTNGAFPTGDYTIVDGNNGVLIYSDGGSNVGSTSLVGSTVQTHGMSVGSRLDLSSTDANFPSTMYKVTASDLNTVTVSDPYSPSSASGTNIGNVFVQDAYHFSSALYSLVNSHFVVSGLSSVSDDTVTGPALHIGGGAAANVKVEECHFDAYGVASPATVLDPDRNAALLADGGSFNSTGVELYRNTANTGGCRLYGNAAAAFVIDGLLVDASTTTALPPAVWLGQAGNTGSFTKHRIANIVRADSSGNSGENNPDVVLVGTTTEGVVCTNVGLVNGPCTLLAPSTQATAVARTKSPWMLGQIGNWSGGRIAGDHPADRRAMGPMGARYPNYAQPTSAWLGSSHTTTSFTDAPDGSNTALHCVVTATDSKVVSAFPITSSLSIGDHFAYGVWVRSATPTVASIGIGPFDGGGSAVVLDKQNVTAPFSGGGWQWVGAMGKVTQAGSGRWSAVLNFPAGTYDFWGAVALLIPAAVDDNDAYEVAGTLRQQPFYLQPGMTGTMDSQKFVAHGGLGTAARFSIGSGSSDISLGPASSKAVEVFDESGVSLGVLSATPFSVNNFTPTSISGLKLWLRGDLGVTGTTNVTSWADQSGNGNDVTQASVPAQPALNASSINSHPAITFASAKALSRSSFAVTAGSARTVFAVCKSAGGVGGELLTQGVLGSGEVWFSLLTDIGGSKDSVCRDNGDFAYFTPSVTLTGVPFIFEQTRPAAGASTDGITQKLNGTPKTVVFNGGPHTLGTELTANTVVGNYSGLDAGFDGDIAEVLAWDRVLTPEELVTVRYYLCVRYQIAIA